MHDIDRTLREAEMGLGYESDHEGYSFEMDGEDSFLNEILSDGESPGGLNDEMEAELAHELLSVSNDAELDQFFGKVFGAAKRFAKSSAGRSLLGGLKSIAKRSLPGLASAAGTFLGGPLGTKLGGMAGKAAAGMFELELEGLSPEDREFEVARSVVRLASDTAHRAATIAARNPQASPAQVAKAALTQSAAVHAPGLVRGTTAARAAGTRQRGTWVRRGRTIILYGA